MYPSKCVNNVVSHKKIKKQRSDEGEGSNAKAMI